MIVSLEFATYTADESDTMVEVCVIIGSGDLPPAGFATYNLTTNDRTAIGMFGVCVYHLNTCMYLLTTHNSW